MAYKYSKGEREFGDLEYENDAQGNTKIDFDEDYIALQAGGNNTLVVSGSMVGVGTTSPDYTLDVAGNIGVNQYIYHNGDANTWINFTDNRIRLNAGGNNFIDCEDPGSAPHKVRINNGGNNIDFVIKDNSGNVYFTADASTSRIGIGTETPSTKLHLASTSTDDLLFLETTEDSSSASPVIKLKRNSSSPATADYLGQLKFQGENDAGQNVTYAKITGKIGSVTDGSEQGIIEFANMKNIRNSSVCGIIINFSVRVVIQNLLNSIFIAY